MRPWLLAGAAALLLGGGLLVWRWAGGDYSAKDLDEFRKSCIASAREKLSGDPDRAGRDPETAAAAYCDCVAGKLRDSVPYRDFVQLDKTFREGGTPPPELARKLTDILSHCGKAALEVRP